MIPKIHKYGASFKGCAVYVLHDKGKATTAERVDWVETRNLAVDASTPRGQSVAWRIMAATSMDADRLKAEAGVKNTGRKSQDHVMHFTLSWHPDEEIDRDEMLLAADQAIAAVGGNDRQAMIVAHNDEKQPHLHVVLNRVSPEDGRLLAKRQDQRKLSAWALEYEQARGQVLCKQRERNARRRDRGDYVWAEKDKPRHIFELEQAANDNSERFERYQAAQKAADIALASRGREMAERHRDALLVLDADYLADRRALLDQAQKSRSAALRAVRDQFRPRYDALDDLFEIKRDEIEVNQDSFLGRMRNRLKALNPRELYQSGIRGGLSEAYTALASEDGAKVLAEQRYNRSVAALEAQERTFLRKASQEAYNRSTDALEALRKRYGQDSADLTLQHSLETAKLKAEWKERNQQRRDALALLSAPDLDQDFEVAASADPIAKGRSGNGDKSPTPDPRERYIRETSVGDRHISREEYLREAREQDDKPDRSRDK